MSRSIGKRPQRLPKVTVIGEGITEQYYFSHLRSLYDFRYVLKPYYFGTTSLQEMERKIAEIVDGGGIAICVFDTDVSQRDEVQRRLLDHLKRKYGQKKNVIFCDSFPSSVKLSAVFSINTESCMSGIFIKGVSPPKNFCSFFDGVFPQMTSPY